MIRENKINVSNKIMFQITIKNNKNKKYLVEAIWNSEIYVKKLHNSYLQGLYYFDSWKSHLKKKIFVSQN